MLSVLHSKKCTLLGLYYVPLKIQPGRLERSLSFDECPTQRQLISLHAQSARYRPGGSTNSHIMESVLYLKIGYFLSYNEAAG